jgi:periodic tryptophan protein 2
LALSNASGGLLASCSWDKTVRLWEVFKSSGTSGIAPPEVLRHTSDALAVAFRPDGSQLAVSCLDGSLHLWDPARGAETGSIDGNRDIGGVLAGGAVTGLAHAARGRCFTTLAYSADGGSLLAGGRSRFVCLYAVGPRLLLKKWQVSHNLALEGVQDKISSKQFGPGGPLSELPEEDGDAFSRKTCVFVRRRPP